MYLDLQNADSAFSPFNTQYSANCRHVTHAYFPRDHTIHLRQKQHAVVIVLFWPLRLELSLVRPLFLASSRLGSAATSGTTGTPSIPLHLFVFRLEEAKADEQTTAEETEDGHVDACHAGDEGGHAHQKETPDGVPNEGDEGDAAPGSEEVLDKGHIDCNGGQHKTTWKRRIRPKQ